MTIVSIEYEKTADAIIIAAPYAPAGPVVAGTSETPNNISLGGEYTFQMEQSGLGFVPGVRVRAAAQADIAGAWIEGICTVFDGVNLTLAADLSKGGGVYDAWNINVAGEQGARGPQGSPGPTGPQGIPGPPGSGSDAAIQDDAPIDNQAYGRRNETWVHVLMYSGDVVDGGNF